MACYSSDQSGNSEYLLALCTWNISSSCRAWQCGLVLRGPETSIYLLHTQVPCGRGLTWAAGDWRHWQAAKEEVHGGQQGLQKTDRTESRASMGGEVDFIGVRAGWLEEGLILTDRPERREGGGGGLVGMYPTKLQLTGQLVLHAVLLISKIMTKKSLKDFTITSQIK